MNAEQYAAFRELRLRVVKGPSLERDSDGWEHNAYQVQLLNGAGGKPSTEFPWKQGLGIKGRPKVGDVLDCLVLEAQGVRNANDFEDWAAEYGYDTDSRKAEKLYEQCKAQSGALHEYLGPDWFEEVLRLEPL